MIRIIESDILWLFFLLLLLLPYLTVEMLTPIGEHMMKELGKWFAEYYFPKVFGVEPNSNQIVFKWRSSKIQRAKESGDVSYLFLRSLSAFSVVI